VRLKKINSAFLLIPLLAFAITAGAQEGLHMTVLGQVQSSTISGDFFVKDFQNNDFALKKESTLGFQAGIAGGYGFTDNLGVSLGVYYAVQGQHYTDYKEEALGLSYTFKRSTSLNYIKVPLHFTFISDASAAITFSGFAGFYYGMLLNYEDETTIQYSDPQGSLFDGTATVKGDNYKWDYTDHGVHTLETFHLSSQPYKKSDFGISAGAGMVLKLGDMVFVPVMLTYQFGLADIKNHSAAATRHNEKVNYWNEITDGNNGEKFSNNSLGIMIGLKFLIDEIAGY
jgi:hypothetical protein